VYEWEAGRDRPGLLTPPLWPAKKRRRARRPEKQRLAEQELGRETPGHSPVAVAGCRHRRRRGRTRPAAVEGCRAAPRSPDGPVLEGRGRRGIEPDHGRRTGLAADRQHVCAAPARQPPISVVASMSRVERRRAPADSRTRPITDSSSPRLAALERAGGPRLSLEDGGSDG